MSSTILTEPQRLLNSLNVALQVRAVQATQAVIKADHEGYHHSPYDWWIFQARMTSPRTCIVCKTLDMRDFRGDWIPIKFQYHRHIAVNRIKAEVHIHCRCTLRWAGRAEAIYQSPFGLLTPEQVLEVWRPDPKQIEKLTPSQIEMIMRVLRSPFRG